MMVLPFEPSDIVFIKSVLILNCIHFITTLFVERIYAQPSARDSPRPAGIPVCSTGKMKDHVLGRRDQDKPAVNAPYYWALSTTLLLAQLKRCSRRYEPFVVAEVKVGMPGAVKGASSNNNSGSSGSPDKGGNGAFNMLAGYIFGGNERKERMAMTMPVFSDSNGLMQFVVRSSDEVCNPSV